MLNKPFKIVNVVERNLNREKLCSVQEAAYERIQDFSICPLRNDFNFVLCICLLFFFVAVVDRIPLILKSHRSYQWTGFAPLP